MTALLVSAAHGQDGSVITLAGEADLTNIGQLRAAVAAQIDRLENRGGVQHLTLNLARLDFLDAAALQLLLRADRALRERGGGLTVTRPCQVVSRILAITRADRVLDVEDGQPAQWQEHPRGPGRDG
jgi:anti-anti-sigma factor